MRLYISADIEGAPGVASRENLLPGRFEYEPARDWMSRMVLAACEEAAANGVDEIVVSDSHGNGQNIRWELMPPNVELVRGWPRPLGMMQGIEAGTYVGALLIGYHAGATNPRGTLSHTISGELFQDVRLNGRSMSEAGVSAATAAHFGVPVLMMAGDDVAVEETRALLGDIVTATLKTSHGFQSARLRSAHAAESDLRTAVREALKRPPPAIELSFKGPIELDIRLRTRTVAEWLSYLDCIEQLDAYTIRFKGRDMLEISRFLQFLTGARGAFG
jgi:D-amino peptidase